MSRVAQPVSMSDTLRGHGYAPLERGDSGGDVPLERELTLRELPKVFSDEDPHPRSQTVEEFEDQVRSVAYAPDGRSFAMADTNGKRVRIFRYRDRKIADGAAQLAEDAVLSCEWGLDGRCYGLAYSPDGKLLATAKICYFTGSLFTSESR